MIRRLLILTMSAVSLASGAWARSPGALELGLDGEVAATHFDEASITYVTVSVPAPVVRVGFFLTDRLEIEPRGGWSRRRFEPDPDDPFSSGGTQVTQTGFGALSLAYHVGNPEGARVYFRGGGIVAFGGDESPDTSTGVEGALGVKPRLGSRWTGRFELAVARLFDRDDVPASWNPSLSLGVSYFTR